MARQGINVRASATTTAVGGLVGAVFVVALTAHETLTFAVALWPLAVLLAGLGLYSSWAMLGGKM